MIDYNVRAERMGWLPSAPQLQTNPLQVVRDARAPASSRRTTWSKGLKDGSLQMSCEDPDHPDNWPRKMFVWRSNILGSSGKGHEYFLKHLLGTSHGVQGKDLGADDAKPEEVNWHDAGAGRQARPAGDARLSHEHDLPVLRHRAADRHLVREERSQHQRHASVHPSVVDGRRSGMAIAQRLGHLQGHSPGSSAKSASGTSASSASVVLTPLMHDTPAELGAAVRREGLEARRVRADPGQDRAADDGGRARLPERVQALHRARPADEQDRQRRQGHRLEHRDRSQAARPAERLRHRGGRDASACRRSKPTSTPAKW